MCVNKLIVIKLKNYTLPAFNFHGIDSKYVNIYETHVGFTKIANSQLREKKKNILYNFICNICLLVFRPPFRTIFQNFQKY